jgi:SAM-dependent methyltransferase
MKDNLSYKEKLEAQIEQYRQVENIHDLPDIFHYWSEKHLRPLTNEVLGVDSIVEFYAKSFFEAADSGLKRFLSIGAGDCSLEINITNRLMEMGLQDFELHCLELSPYLLERAENQAQANQIEKHIKFHETDINQWQASQDYAAVMASHALHHFVELESIFAAVDDSLIDGGLFVTNDMIGRNGHMRWPEVLEFLDHIWAFMPERYKYNRQLDRVETKFVNWDCSGEGFEGIRAQDILPLLKSKFPFRSFLTFGGIIDIFTDRSFGHNFDPNDSNDLAFIDFIQFLNTRLIDSGVIKPTVMFAVMKKGWEGVPDVYRHWTPDFCTRDVNR